MHVSRGPTTVWLVYIATCYSISHLPMSLQHPDEIKYWWRAQTAAYFARFNDEAIADVAALRRAPGALHVVGDAGAVARAGAGNGQLLNSIPFPAGVISTHVRHGDKASGIEGRELQVLSIH
jgi:hypothetical protein